MKRSFFLLLILLGLSIFLGGVVLEWIGLAAVRPPFWGKMELERYIWVQEYGECGIRGGVTNILYRLLHDNEPREWIELDGDANSIFASTPSFLAECLKVTISGCILWGELSSAIIYWKRLPSAMTGEFSSLKCPGCLSPTRNVKATCLVDFSISNDLQLHYLLVLFTSKRR
jgi:hypothetical protein